MERQKIQLKLERIGLAAQGLRREYRCRFIRAGQVRATGGMAGDLLIEARALQQAADDGLFDHRAVFIDHAGFFDYPSLRNLAGSTLTASYNPPEASIEGIIRLFATPAGQAAADLLDEILLQEGQGPDVGMSAVLWVELDDHPSPAPLGAALRQIHAIQHVESVDLVFEPAADGRVLQALSAVDGEASPTTLIPVSRKGGTPMPSEKQDNLPSGTGSRPVTGVTVSGSTAESLPVMALTAAGVPATGSSAEGSFPCEETPRPAPASEAGGCQAYDPQDWLLALGQTAAQAMIFASGLPPASQERLALQPYRRPDEVTAAIQAECAYLARLQQDQVIQLGGLAPRSAQVSGVRHSLDQVSEALDALLVGRRPAQAAPLSGIRELYHLLSGDFEMSGLFQPERVTLANVNSSTLASLVANALNKRVVNEFIQYPQWWAPLVSEEDYNSLEVVRWIILGGVGELPTVAEGASYTELHWGDSHESANFVKKGGYLGLTLEAIDKDDTGRLRTAPRALAQAAWLTLSRSVSAIFTDNSGAGPALSDGLALFHASHGNLGSTALSLSAYAAARTAMRKQTELNSGERLGALTAPRYLLVPPDLEITALQVLASQFDYTYSLSNGQAAPENVFAEGDDRQQRLNLARQRVIVVDLWSDTNNWAACADPRLWPTIGVGYRYGRSPEVFSVASPTAGLMFTNDTMPVKVRYFFAVGPMDYRGLYKANVA
jgi:hypothetical protein